MPQVVEFDEETHTYWCGKQKADVSVTGLVSLV